MRVIKVIIILAALLLSGWLVVGGRVPKMQHVDCEKVKTSCSRKSGCKCKRECDSTGRRQPAQGGTQECPSFCCEDKCECHPACP